MTIFLILFDYFERLDLYLRTKKPRVELRREVDRLTHRIDTTDLKYNKAALMHVATMINWRGVCQDFAQILISLLRMDGIPARYVVGMMIGEGETHAWAKSLAFANAVLFKLIQTE